MKKMLKNTSALKSKLQRGRSTDATSDLIKSEDVRGGAGVIKVVAQETIIGLSSTSEPKTSRARTDAIARQN